MEKNKFNELVANPPLTSEEKKLVKEDKLIQLYLLTGVRRNEIYELFRNKVVGGAIRITGKGSKDRLIPVNKVIIDLIEELKPNWLWKSPKELNRHFVKISETHNLEKFNPHRCRTTFATDLIKDGVDLVSISTLMGHSSITTTARYVKLNVDYFKAIIDQRTNPQYHIDGMSPEELKQEILRLRQRLNRCETIGDK